MPEDYRSKWDLRQPGSDFSKKVDSAVLKAADGILKADPPAAPARISWANLVQQDELTRSTYVKLAVLTALEDPTVGPNASTATDEQIQAVVDPLIPRFAGA